MTARIVIDVNSLACIQDEDDTSNSNTKHQQQQHQQEQHVSASTTADTTTTAPTTKADDMNSVTSTSKPSTASSFNPADYDDKQTLSSASTWPCTVCTLENRLRAAVCRACGNRKPASVDERLLELQQPASRSKGANSKRKALDGDATSEGNQQQSSCDTPKVCWHYINTSRALKVSFCACQLQTESIANATSCCSTVCMYDLQATVSTDGSHQQQQQAEKNDTSSHKPQHNATNNNSNNTQLQHSEDTSSDSGADYSTFIRSNTDTDTAAARRKSNNIKAITPQRMLVPAQPTPAITSAKAKDIDSAIGQVSAEKNDKAIPIETSDGDDMVNDDVNIDDTDVIPSHTHTTTTAKSNVSDSSKVRSKTAAVYGKGTASLPVELYHDTQPETMYEYNAAAAGAGDDYYGGGDYDPYANDYADNNDDISGGAYKYKPADDNYAHDHFEENDYEEQQQYNEEQYNEHDQHQQQRQPQQQQQQQQQRLLPNAAVDNNNGWLDDEDILFNNNNNSNNHTNSDNTSSKVTSDTPSTNKKRSRSTTAATDTTTTTTGRKRSRQSSSSATSRYSGHEDVVDLTTYQPTSTIKAAAAAADDDIADFSDPDEVQFIDTIATTTSKQTRNGSTSSNSSSNYTAKRARMSKADELREKFPHFESVQASDQRLRWEGAPHIEFNTFAQDDTQTLLKNFQKRQKARATKRAKQAASAGTKGKAKGTKATRGGAARGRGRGRGRGSGSSSSSTSSKAKAKGKGSSSSVSFTDDDDDDEYDDDMYFDNDGDANEDEHFEHPQARRQREVANDRD
jgi:hypothetical protein